MESTAKFTVNTAKCRQKKKAKCRKNSKVKWGKSQIYGKKGKKFPILLLFF